MKHLKSCACFPNYGRPGENQLQLILAGQPELLRRLMAPHLRQFNGKNRRAHDAGAARCGRNRRIHRLPLRSKNGSVANIFHRKALKYLVSRSGGIPRRINVLCHNSMLLAYAAGAKQVTPKMAREAVADYEDLFSSANQSYLCEGLRSVGPPGRSGWPN